MKKIEQILIALRQWNTWQFWLVLHPEIDSGGVYWIDWKTAKELAQIITEAK